MRRDAVLVLLIWLVLLVLGEAFVSTINIYPTPASIEAEEIDRAVRLLMMLAVPVFTFVVAVMAYSIWRFRARDEAEEGPPLYTHQPFAVGWLVVTTALAALLFYNPGFTGWQFLHRNPNADLVVQVTAAQWHWHVTYPQYDLSIKSRPIGFERMEDNTVLALPAGRRVKFEVTSVDVIHSFWIPAFRMKVDAVPGMVTTMYVTPVETGDFEEDMAFRVQCAELCGTGHPRMNMRVAVMEPEAFEQWVERQKQMEMGGMEMPMGTEEEHGHDEMEMPMGEQGDQHGEGHNE